MKILYCIPTNNISSKSKPVCSLFLLEEFERLRKILPETDRFNIDISSRRFIFVLFVKLLKIKVWKYSIVHVNYGSISGFSLILCLKVLAPKVGIVLTLGGSDVFGHENSNIFHQLRNTIVNRASLFATYLADDVIVVADKLALKLKITKFKVIPRGIDIDLFKPGISKPSTINTKDTFNIFFSMPRKESWVKNLPFAKEVIKKLNSNSEGLSFTLNVVTGKTRDELYSELLQCDILLLTSFHEGSPNIVKEAMACNLPIVSSNVGDVKEMFFGGVNLIVIDGYSAEVYSQAILGLAKGSLVSNGREIILEKGIDAYSSINKIKQVYDQF